MNDCSDIYKVHDAADAHDSVAADEAAARPTELHPWVYRSMIALAAWFAVAAWLFAGGGVSDYLLFIVSDSFLSPWRCR